MNAVKNTTKGFDILAKLSKEEVAVLSEIYNNDKLVSVLLKIKEIIKLKEVNKLIQTDLGLDVVGLTSLVVRKEKIKAKEKVVEDLIELSRKAKNYTNN